MKRIFVVVLFALLIASSGQAFACVGKTLYIGISGSVNEQLLAEMVSVLVSERTGTSVKIVTYKDSKEIYAAVKHGQVGLLIESTDHALELLNKSRENNPKAAYDVAKKEFRNNLNLVWLEPFGAIPGSGANQLYAPVVSVDVLGNLPALPKLINKLAGIMGDGTYAKLIRSVNDKEKTKKVARDFLKSRKLI